MAAPPNIAFTVLDDGFSGSQASSQPRKPAWQNMYDSNILSAPPNSPFSNFEVSHVDSDYETLTHQSSSPQIPQSYNDGVMNNELVHQTNMNYNLPANAPHPLPSYMDLPAFNPPYGMAYPSSKYSAYDGELAMNAGVISYHGLPGVPVSSPTALQDARDSASVPMGPLQMAVVAENHYREGFKNGRENYASTYAPSCSECIAHIQGCTVCNHFVSGHLKFYQIGIALLIILVLILLWMLFRRISPKTMVINPN